MNLEMQKIKSLIEEPLDSKEDTAKYIKESIRELLDINYHQRLIRQGCFTLSETRFGLSFEMSGYDTKKDGDCYKYNQYIFNFFVNGLNISKDMALIYLDFYKGNPVFQYLFWGSKEGIKITQYYGETTTEIIYDIIRICLIDNPEKNSRRRR
jgi:hypothetical protein